MEPLVNIVIPTFNRAHLIGQAVEAALGQSYRNLVVTVVDDGSTDATRDRLSSWFPDPRFQYIQLAENAGTAQAKNVGLALTAADACTFHDSDDLPHRDKVLRQARVMAQPAIHADACLNWGSAGREPGSRVDMGCVLTHHELLLPDGRRVEISRSLSLVDDFFPNLQMGSTVPGDWTHVNSGLFRVSVFARLGGFSDCIEEDREFRNRLIMAGEGGWGIPEPLLTKIETPDSLTQSAASDYDSARRKADRQAVWDSVARWRASGEVPPVPVDLSGVSIGFVSNPALLARSGALMTKGTRDRVDMWVRRLGPARAADRAGTAEIGETA